MGLKLVFVALVLTAIAFLLVRPEKTVDDVDYSRAPPLFVFRYVLPLIEWAKTFVHDLSPPVLQVFDELMMVQAAHLLLVAVKLDIPDHLVNGPLSVAKLAEITETNPQMMYRVLRRLALSGYFRELPPAEEQRHTPSLLLLHRFENTPKSYTLTRAARVGFRAMLVHQMNDIVPLYQHMERILKPHSDHVNLFTEVHNVADMWDYFVGPVGANFNRAMEDLDGIGGDIAAQDFAWNEHCGTVIDVGGGKGRYLAAILHHHPAVSRGVLFDLPFAISEAQKTWPISYRADINSRTSFVSGSFFNASDIPESLSQGPRCYVLRVVLHDWPDEDCVRILSNIATKVRVGDSVMIVEAIPEAYGGNMPAVGAMDVIMATFRGKERTRAELDDLLNRSGLALVSDLVYTRSMFRVAVSTKTEGLIPNS